MCIAIFLPDNTAFYRATLEAMINGFEACGVTSIGLTGLLEVEKLNKYCLAHKVDVVLEMNRSRCEIPELKKDVRHVAWIVDQRHKALSEFQGSEILYFFGTNWKDNYAGSQEGMVEWLPPGYAPESYYPDKKAVKNVDFVFIGHIPKPWSEAELSRSISNEKPDAEHFGDIAAECVRTWRNLGGTHKLSFDQYHAVIAKVLDRYAVSHQEIQDSKLKYDIAVRNGRMYNRCNLIDTILEVSESLELYGTENWKEWKKYKKFYRKFLTEPKDICDIYRSSYFTLHEGVGPHFRTFDCMGSGGVLTYLSSSQDDTSEGINALFEPYQHYIPFDEENLADTVARYKRDKRHYRYIGEQAALHVAGSHTWKHRAQRILNDLSQ